MIKLLADSNGAVAHMAGLLVLQTAQRGQDLATVLKACTDHSALDHSEIFYEAACGPLPRKLTCFSPGYSRHFIISSRFPH